MLGSPVCIYLPPHNIKTYTISLYMSSTNVRNNLENIPFTLGNYGVTVALCWCGSFIEFEDVLVDSGVIGPGCDEISAGPRELWTKRINQFQYYLPIASKMHQRSNIGQCVAM